MTTFDLDDLSIYPRLDPTKMRDLLRDFPRLCGEGWQAGNNLTVPWGDKRFARIAFLGMGGSAVAGEMAASLLLRLEPDPPLIISHRDYGIPNGIDKDTLVVASSYSGETEETLSAVELALERQATILAITKGGTLARMAQNHRLAWLPITLDTQPRATLPFTLSALLRVLTNLGIMHGIEKQMEPAIQRASDVQKRLDPSVKSEKNAAKSLAQKLHGRIPVVYTAGLFSPVARRWKTQINENSKNWAFVEELPEVHHNGIVGIDCPADLRDKVSVLLLQPHGVHPRTALRFDITRVLLSEAGVPIMDVPVEQNASPLAQMLAATLLGDYVSYYLALLNGVDPTPVDRVSKIKARLSAQA